MGIKQYHIFGFRTAPNVNSCKHIIDIQVALTQNIQLSYGHSHVNDLGIPSNWLLSRAGKMACLELSLSPAVCKCISLVLKVGTY